MYFFEFHTKSVYFLVLQNKTKKELCFVLRYMKFKIVHGHFYKIAAVEKLESGIGLCLFLGVYYVRLTKVKEEEVRG